MVEERLEIIIIVVPNFVLEPILYNCSYYYFRADIAKYKIIYNDRSIKQKGKIKMPIDRSFVEVTCNKIRPLRAIGRAYELYPDLSVYGIP